MVYFLVHNGMDFSLFFASINILCRMCSYHTFFVRSSAAAAASFFFSPFCRSSSVFLSFFTAAAVFFLFFFAAAAAAFFSLFCSSSSSSVFSLICSSSYSGFFSFLQQQQSFFPLFSLVKGNVSYIPIRVRKITKMLTDIDLSQEVWLRS